MYVNDQHGPLAPEWMAPFEEAWRAYGAGTVPVGAAIVDAAGHVVSRGRNRILDEPEARQIGRSRLAHAEVNAILGLGGQEVDPRTLTMLTTAEPCPLCIGAIVMANIRSVRFAAREPFAGSVALLEATPYVRSKAIVVRGPEDDVLEGVLMTLASEFHLRVYGPRVPELIEISRALRPDAVALAEQLRGSGAWTTLRELAADDAFATLSRALESSR